MCEVLSAAIGESLLSDYSVDELPDHGEASSDILVDVVLTARIEALEVENRRLKTELSTRKVAYFRIEHIAVNDSLVRFYTGFTSYETCLYWFSWSVST